MSRKLRRNPAFGTHPRIEPLPPSAQRIVDLANALLGISEARSHVG